MANSASTLPRSAREVLDHGLQRGAWTESHRDRIRDVMAEMTPRERELLVEEVLLAANNREIEVELLGPPI